MVAFLASLTSFLISAASFRSSSRIAILGVSRSSSSARRASMRALSARASSTVGRWGPATCPLLGQTPIVVR